MEIFIDFRIDSFLFLFSLHFCLILTFFSWALPCQRLWRPVLGLLAFLSLVLSEEDISDYSHVTLRDVLVEVSFTPPHPSPWSSNQQIRQSPQSQNHRHRRPSGKVGDDCSGVEIEAEVEQTHIYHIIELLLCRVAAWNRNNCHKKSWLHSLFKMLLWIQRLQDPPMNSTTSRSSIMNSKTPNDRKTAPNSFVDTVPSPSWWFSKLFCQIYHLYDRNLIKHDENPLESLDIFVWHHNRKLERM